MPRNASGTFTLVAGNPVATGTIIDSDWANNTMDDLGVAMTNSLSRNANGGMLAPLGHVDGTVGLPAISFTNAPSTGLYRAGVGDLRTSVVGVDVVRYTNGEAALWDVTDSIWYPLLTSKTNGNILETVDLIAAQTVVPFVQNIAGAALFVNGTSGDRGRLLEGFDYTYDAATNEVTLTTPFPATTKLTASFKDESTVTIAALSVAYSNVTSGYTAENVQDALDESASNLVAHVAEVSGAHVATAVTYDDTTSGLGGTVQIALDALDGKVDSLAPPPSWGILTANATLTTGQRVFANTTGGIFTITLPATPTADDTVAIADYAGTFKDFPPIIDRNGSNIMGKAEDMNLDTANLSALFTYVDATQGWRFT